jgi:archaetidylserine synthase
MDLKETGIECFMAVPDLVSLLNMSFGFLAILMAINNQIALSASFIIVALIFDSVDGWTARKLSRVDEYGFGKNIDSLSDVVSFGVAPGALLYCIGKGIGIGTNVGNNIGTNIVLPIDLNYFVAIITIISVFMVVCGVLRLTRFNVIADKVDFDGFIGVPIPAIGILLATFVLSGFFNIYLAMILMVVISILMISNIKYKKLNNPIYLAIFAICVLLTLIRYPIVVMSINIPATIVFILALLYVLIGLLKSLFKVH